MLFSSIIFLFYFLPLVLVVYYLCSFSVILKNGILLIFSLFFYAWGEPKYVFLMMGSILSNYLLGLLVHRCRNNKVLGSLTIVLTCIINLVGLFIFKYLAFVIRNLNEIMSFTLKVPSIPLPIGISFFTFQAMSYVIDVYRGDGKVQRNPFYVGLYISLFPQLIAGPIVRYRTVSEQIKFRRETLDKFVVGCCRFITGLSKKVLISNNMAIIVDRIFTMNSNGSVPMTLAWLGSIAYTFQIFFDFSGYSDMAIGLGLIFGFKFEENFNYPYISKSISEFWRRWHMSLGTWFKNYVYFPLGGSRVANKDKVIRNLFVVWLLTGVWHGAEWNFILWGLLNFVFIAMEKLVSFEDIEVKSIYKHLYAMFIVNLGWVLFRAPNLIEAGEYIKSMFTFVSNGFWSNYTYMFLKEYFVFFIAAAILSTPFARRVNKFIINKAKGYKTLEYIYPVTIMLLFLICVSYLVKGAYNPFIYFNF